MGRAVIIFSDGSKRMARNLDDHNFRWAERANAKTEALMDGFRAGVHVRDCQSPPSPEKAFDWYLELKQQRYIIVQHKRFMSARYSDYPQSLQGDALHQEILLQTQNIKRYLTSKGYRITKSDNLIKDGVGNELDILELQKRIAYLEKRLAIYEGEDAKLSSKQRSKKYLTRIQGYRYALMAIFDGKSTPEIEAFINEQRDMYARDIEVWGDGITWILDEVEHRGLLNR